MTDKVLNRNASPSCFGWSFQIAAAVVLALRNIEDVAFILVENDEDIELELLDGGIVYAQAKAYFEANKPGEGSLKRLKGALKTLNDSFGRPACRELVYVTNDLMPFGKSPNDLPFGRNSFLEYRELGPKQQEAIMRILNSESYDPCLVDKLAVYAIWYHGSDMQTRCEEIDRCIGNFLDRLDFKSASRPSEGRLRGDWEQALGFSASSDSRDMKAKKISKEAFVWPVIVESCMGLTSGLGDLDLDEDQLEELESTYAREISAQINRFDVVSKVTTDYSEYAKVSSESAKQKRIAFASARWQDYVALLGADVIDDEEVKQAFVEVIVSKIIKKQKTIEKVKNGVNLPD